MISDPIADMLTRIRNASRAAHSVVEMPSSILKVAIADTLKREGYIRGYEVSEDGAKRTLKVSLKYFKEESVIAGIERVSRSSQRVYVGHESVPRTLGGLGIVILSTAQGVITGKDARNRGVGGEVLCRVW